MTDDTRRAQIAARLEKMAATCSSPALDGLLREAAIELTSADAAGGSGDLKHNLAVLLNQHYVLSIECDHDTQKDRAICACGTWTAPWRDTPVQAVAAWSAHVVQQWDGMAVGVLGKMAKRLRLEDVLADNNPKSELIQALRNFELVAALRIELDAEVGRLTRAQEALQQATFDCPYATCIWPGCRAAGTIWYHPACSSAEAAARRIEAAKLKVLPNM